MAAARRHIVRTADRLIQQLTNDRSEPPTGPRRDAVEVISAELLPLCEALRWIGRRGPRLLRTKHLGTRGRPLWLLGVASEVRREPLGDVLVLAPWNYPLLLAGVQVAQALAAGNRVWLKPAPGCEAVSATLVDAFHTAGVPGELLQQLESDPRAAQQRIDAGVDLVLLTGSSETGRAVLEHCAPTLTPAVMELSGCDAMIIGPEADLDHAARLIRFGLTVGGGATCIAPRRLIIRPETLPQLVPKLRHQLADHPPVAIHPAAQASVTAALAEAWAAGARDVLDQQSVNMDDRLITAMQPTILAGVEPHWNIASADLFAPLASILQADSDDLAVGIVNRCRYRLAASVIGPRSWAERIAARLDVGQVAINDVIFPTADPRVPFGGCGASGFGVTRGAEGLLAMTRPKVVAIHGRWNFMHLRPRRPGDAKLLMRLLHWLHRRG